MDFGNDNDWQDAIKGGQGRDKENIEVAAWGIGIAGFIFVTIVAIAIMWAVLK